MKLFRAQRLRLLENKNIKKYTFYAVGEILLVMIGISLAFQVTKWYDRKLEKKIEISYYQNLKDEVLDDKKLITSQKDYNEYFYAQFKYARDIIKSNDRTKMDTLGSIIRDMSNYSDFDKEGNIYETLVNSGEIQLLNNNEIIKGIRFIEEKYNYINRMESIHYDAIMNHVVLATNPTLRYSDSKIMRPEMVFDYKFDNLIVILLQVMVEKRKTYNEALEGIERVVTLVDQELVLH